MPEPHNPDDWYPFVSGVAFKLAEFVYKDDQTSAAKIDQLLEIMEVSLQFHGDHPPFLDHEDPYKTIDTIPVGGVPWQLFTFTYKGPKPDNPPNGWMPNMWSGTEIRTNSS